MNGQQGGRGRRWEAHVAGYPQGKHTPTIVHPPLYTHHITQDGDDDDRDRTRWRTAANPTGRYGTHHHAYKQLLIGVVVGAMLSRWVHRCPPPGPVPIIIIPILSDVVGIQWWGCAYLVGILLHGPPGTSLFLLAVCSSSLHHPPCKQRLAAVG